LANAIHLIQNLGNQTMSTCELNLGTSDVIAILAVLVAGLSALYAKWAWREARRSNEISLSNHKKEIYDAFFELKMHMLQKAEFAELSEVSKFYYPSRNASFYLPKKLAEKISKYFEACFSIADTHRKNGGITTDGLEKCRPHLKVEKALSSEIDETISELIRSVNT
jgi:hypothetical protein